MAVIVTALGLVLRFCGMNFESGDFQSFLNPWWFKIQAGGFGDLSTQVGNYNIPYQIVIFLMSRTGIKPLLAYKLLSVIFDVVLAVSAGLLASEACKKKSSFLPLAVYSVVFCSLTVIFNSAFWAQCDSIYVSFILLAIYFTMKDRHITAFVMLGIALAFKLQVVFILPAFFYYYFTSKKISLLNFLLIPAVDIVMCLPAVFAGRPFADIFIIYAEQTDYGKLIQMNYPNIYAFMCDGGNTVYYSLFKGFSIALTMIILCVGLLLVIRCKTDMTDLRTFLAVSIWTAFTCLMFLSSMHERYSYLLDVLLIIYALSYRRHFVPLAICSLISLRGYCFYLFDGFEALPLKITAVINIGVYLYLTFCFVRYILNEKKADTVAAV